VSYLDVIDGERQVLQSQLQASHLAGTQAVSTVNLIRALGGGWGDVKPDANSDVAANGTQQVAKQ
jgi:multidrug efflux system outer membrane protein